MSEYKISYVLTTYNKLPYLRQVLGRLVAARLPDEEIVVADGGSTDGSVAYLQDLLARGQIQQFESARDKGEAHGFNKCILRARGEILKLITDDDAFNYPVIRACADFMRENPELDAMMGVNADMMVNDPAHVHISDFPANSYLKWLDKKEPFSMIGLPLMIRRSSLSLLGLFYTNIVLVDIEYTFRITKMQANVAWCTNLLSVHVNNPDGNYNRMGAKRVRNEFMRMHVFFQVSTWWEEIATKLRGQAELAKQPLAVAKRAVYQKMGWQRNPKGPGVLATNYVPRPAEEALAAVYRVCDEVMQSYSQNHKTEFLHRQSAQAMQKALAPQT